MHQPPLSLYVHIPWCVRKCPYCDFNSHTTGDVLPEAEYVEALRRDLTLDAPAAAGRRLTSIFFGGGTPSLLSPQAIGTILEIAERLVGFADDIEITLEANPGTTEQSRFQGYRQAGVNRLSLGVQSLNEEHLRALGRIHDRDQALRAVDEARRAGFDNLNIDLMHGLPDQQPDDACSDLRAALAMAPTHLSWYQLTIEPNTEFFKRPPTLPADDTLAAIQDAGTALLADAGFAQYEVSAYAQPDRRARHNLNYWEFGDYIGIGAGAHGKLTYPDGRIVRTQKTRLPRDYLAAAQGWLSAQSWPTAEQSWLIAAQNGPVAAQDGAAPTGRASSAIPAEELPFEFMLNALRLIDGVETRSFQKRTGLSARELEPALTRLRTQGLLVSNPERLQATPLGQRFLNSVVGEFLP